MRRFLVEAYTPANSPIGDVEDRARRAAIELSLLGTCVHYVRAIFVPGDETCFYLLDAETSHAAAAALERAGVSPTRVTEAVDATADREDQQ